MDATQTYQNKASSSIKWTIVGELSAKAIVPIMNMILARLLAPEIFGLVASITVITNFAEIISESGFSRYILQQKFATDQKKRLAAGTATIVSLILSFAIFGIIVLFSKPLASFVGAPGYEMVMILAAAQIPFYAITNMQMSLFRRDFKFGYLAIVRVSSCLIQLLTSCAAALFGLAIWSLPIGTLSSLVCQFLLLIIFDKNSLSFSFSIQAFKEMWACSGMFLISAIVVWADSSINVLFASHFLGQAESGYIKNGFSTVTGIVGLLTSIYSPVFISLLAKLDNGSELYASVFNKYQKALSLFLIPLGIGMFVFQDFLTLVFFGSGWEQAAVALGWYGLMNCIKTASGGFVITAWSAEGKPFWIFVSDLFSMLALILAWLLTRGLEYHLVVIIVSCAYLPTNFVCLALCKKTLKISPVNLIKNIIGCFGPAIVMGFFGYFLSQIYSNFWLSFLYVVSCIVLYFLIVGFAYEDYLSCLCEVFVGRKFAKALVKKGEYVLLSRQ